MRFFSKFSTTGKAAIIIIIIFGGIAIGGKYIMFYPHNTPSGESLQPPSSKHIMGTDDLGIDMWSQICYGTRISLTVGLGTALLAGITGSILGMVSGYFYGAVDRIIMRITDIMIALPHLPVMIVLGAFLGPRLENIIIVLSLFSWTVPARVIRSKVLSLKQEKYITAAKSFGAGFWHLSIKHLLPGVFPLVMVSIVKLTGRAIIAEASLSFLGLGDPLSKSLGLILHHAINFKGVYFTDYWKWWIVLPSFEIILLVSCIALIGRELEQFMNIKE